MTVDDLSKYGMVRMDDDEIEGFLSSQSTGVLALSAEDGPLMRPMSYWYDGDSELYFLYVLGGESRKQTWSRRSDVARFLVYSAETPFNWRSVLLTGQVNEVPGSERDEILGIAEMRWRPDVFEQASEAEDTRLYEFAIDEQTGIKHIGLPPNFERDPEKNRPH